MAWKKTDDVAQYKGADWDNLIKKVSGTTPEEAIRIANLDPNISFFFYARESMFLEGKSGPDGWSEKGMFNPGDAVFFSGEPWYGSAPQCDSYQKDHMTIAYVSGSPEDLASVGQYYLADGSPAISVACIFAGNLNMSPLPSGNVQLSKNVNIPSGYPIANANPDVYSMLQSGKIKELQDKGITVLLTLLGNHDAAGWSNFNDQATAQNFADQLNDIVAIYGLDGIDIDDEYSNPPSTNSSSLAMVTTLMKETLGDKIISKALFADSQFFTPSWEGNKLSDNLTYGWQMAYGSPPQYVLPGYVNLGMKKDTLSMGFWSGQPSSNPSGDVKWIVDNGYEGVMVYAFQEQANKDLMGQLVNDLYGSGNWNYKAGN